MAQRNQSKFVTSGGTAADDPLAQPAGFQMDADDRQYIDNQIRGVQQHLVDAPLGSSSDTATNLGTGAEVFKEKSAGEFKFRKVKAGSNVTVTENANDITIAASGGGSASVADDIGKSGPTNIDRVLGLKGVQFETADTLAVGEVWKKRGSKLRAGKPVMPGHYDVMDYGFVADDATDNTGAFQTLINTTLGAATTATGDSVTILFPPGAYYFDDDIHVTRPCHIVGAGHRAASLRFAAGKGIRIHDALTCPLEGGSGRMSVIDNLNFVFAQPSLPEWSNTAFSLGEKIHAPDNNRYHYECIKAGTTDVAAPDFTLGYLPIDTVTRPVAARARLGLLIHDYAQATDFFWECTTAGTTGAGTPTLAHAMAGDTTPDGSAVWTARSASGSWIPDGSVIWATRVAAGIYADTRCYVRNCELYGSLNAGIHIQAGQNVPITNANHCGLKDVNIIQCGIGVVLRGSDTERSVLDHVAVQAAGYGQTGTGGVGIWDGSFLGSWVGFCEVEVSTGYSYIMGLYDADPAASNGTAGALVCCSSETGYPGALLGIGCAVLGGAHGAGFAAGSVYTKLDNNGGVRLRETDSASAKHAAAYLHLRASDAVFGYGSDDESSYLSLRTYEALDLGRTGWWSESYDYGVRAGFSFSGLAASEGPGWNWQPLGVFQGGSKDSFTGQYFLGLDAAALRSRHLRGTGHTYGSYEVGDRFDLQSTGVTGNYTGVIVKTAGIRGASDWTALTEVGSETYWEPTAQNTGIVPTPGGTVWQCTVAGTTDATEPDWTTALPDGGATVGDVLTEGGGVEWTLVGFVPEYNYLGQVGSAAPSAQKEFGGTQSTSDNTPVYITLATLAVGDVAEVDAIVRISSADASVRQSFKLSALVYGAAGPTATLDGGSLTDTSPRGTGTAVAELDLSGADVRLKITGIAATDLVSVYEASVL